MIISPFPKAQENSFRNSDRKYVFQNIVIDNFSPEKKLEFIELKPFWYFYLGVCTQHTE